MKTSNRHNSVSCGLETDQSNALFVGLADLHQSHDEHEHQHADVIHSDILILPGEALFNRQTHSNPNSHEHSAGLGDLELTNTLSSDYLAYLNHHRQNKPSAPLMTQAEFSAAQQTQTSPSLGFFEKLKLLTQRVTQTCRLMIGVQDYDIYLQHMKMHHPDVEPLNRDAFYRYCLDARFGGNGNMNKCPC